MQSHNKLYNYLAAANTFIEWIEYSFFLFLGPIISKLFFPSYAENSQLLLAYGLFAIAYLIRPFSSLLFGYCSDRFGRKPPMIFAMALMGVATLMIGLLPIYAEIGLLSPILLLICRLMQSMAVSGEYQSSAIFLMEHATKNKAFAGSLIIASASGGIFVGGLLASIVVNTNNFELYWRVPFVATGIIAIALSILRTKIQETPVFTQLQKSGEINKNPIAELLNYKKEILHIIVVSAFVCVFVYTCNGYYSNYLISHALFNKSSAYLYCALTELVVTILAPIIAYYCGEKNNNTILIIGIIGLMLNAPIQFYAAHNQNYSLIIASLCLYAIFDALITSSIAFYLYKILPADFKCTGIGFSWNFSAAFFGSTAPLLSAHLVSLGYMIAPGVLVLVYGMMALLIIAQRSQLRNYDD